MAKPLKSAREEALDNTSGSEVLESPSCKLDDGRVRRPEHEGARKLPPLVALSYFEVAARTCSFAAAAKELHVTPAAISHQIKALEEILGVELFIRHHRKVTPTPAAQAALPGLQGGFVALAEAVESIRAYGEEKWIITVCAEPLFATKWLVPRLHRFYAQCPEAEVRLQASLRSVDVVKGGPVSSATFRRAGIDLSVRFGYGEYADLEAQRLLDISLVPVCSPSLHQRPTRKALLRSCLLSDNTSYRSPERFGWREWFHQAGIAPTEGLCEQRFGNGLLALEAAVTGQGFSWPAKISSRPSSTLANWRSPPTLHCTARFPTTWFGHDRLLSDQSLSRFVTGSFMKSEEPPGTIGTDWFLGARLPRNVGWAVPRLYRGLSSSLSTQCSS